VQQQGWDTRVQQQRRQRQQTGSLMGFLLSWEGTVVLLRRWRGAQQGCSSIWQLRLLQQLVVVG
jgi:hypothetical protein